MSTVYFYPGRAVVFVSSWCYGYRREIFFFLVLWFRVRYGRRIILTAFWWPNAGLMHFVRGPIACLVVLLVCHFVYHLLLRWPRRGVCFFLVLLQNGFRVAGPYINMGSLGKREWIWR